MIIFYPLPIPYRHLIMENLVMSSQNHWPLLCQMIPKQLLYGAKLLLSSQTIWILGRIWTQNCTVTNHESFIEFSVLAYLWLTFQWQTFHSKHCVWKTTWKIWENCIWIFAQKLIPNVSSQILLHSVHISSTYPFTAHWTVLRLPVSRTRYQFHQHSMSTFCASKLTLILLVHDAECIV